MKKTSKKEFQRKYCKNSKINLKTYLAKYVTLKCNCNDKDCQGWATIHNDKFFINQHKNLYQKGKINEKNIR